MELPLEVEMVVRLSVGVVMFDSCAAAEAAKIRTEAIGVFILASQADRAVESMFLARGIFDQGSMHLQGSCIFARNRSCL